MSVNRFQPHILILPEDDENSHLANGFHLEVSRLRQIQVLPVARGWLNVLHEFESEHIRLLDANPNRYMVLLIDFDQQVDRFQQAKDVVPTRLAGRVFVLGVYTEPDGPDGLFSAKLGSREQVGSLLAKDCRENTQSTWGHELLRHNEFELERLRESICALLFH